MQVGDIVEVKSAFEDARKTRSKDTLRRGKVVAISKHVFVVEFTCKSGWMADNPQYYRESFRLVDADECCRVVV